MKFIPMCIMLFILAFSSVHAELTKDDLEEIRKIVKEEVKEGGDKVKTELMSEIESIRGEIKSIRVEIKSNRDLLEASGRQIAKLDENLNRRIDDKYNLLIWGIGLLIVLFGLPQLWSRISETRRMRREETELVKTVRDLQERMSKIEAKQDAATQH